MIITIFKNHHIWSGRDLWAEPGIVTAQGAGGRWSFGVGQPRVSEETGSSRLEMIIVANRMVKYGKVTVTMWMGRVMVDCQKWLIMTWKQWCRKWISCQWLVMPLMFSRLQHDSNDAPAVVRPPSSCDLPMGAAQTLEVGTAPWGRWPLTVMGMIWEWWS